MHTNTEKQTKINLDPANLESMIGIMDQYGDTGTMFPGENENGELVMLSVFHDKIVTATYQRNNWIRKNTYYRDGTNEETYEK